MTSHRLLVSIFAAGLAVGACKQDAPSVDSGISGDKEASELTPAEQDQLCEAVADYRAEIFTADDAKTAGCTLAAIHGALQLDGGVDSCNTLRDECLAQPVNDPTPTMCTLGIDFTMCMATVAELEACYEEYAQAGADLQRALSCAKMAEYATTAPDITPEVGEDCSRAKAKCPTIVAG